MKPLFFIAALSIVSLLPAEARAGWRIGAAAMANRERFSGQMSPR